MGGRTLLDRVLAACADAGTTVVVGRPPAHRPAGDAGPARTRRAAARSPRWTPACGTPRREHVLVLSADLPFLGPGDRTAAAGRPARRAGADGVLLTDPDGRDQPLVAAYRADALRRELAVLAAEHGGLTGLPLRRLTAALDLTRISDPVASFDCDTWDDIAAARARIREHGHVLDEWISAVKDELGIDLDVDTGVLLDLARDAAHGVARPAAPLTTFLGRLRGRAGRGRTRGRRRGLPQGRRARAALGRRGRPPTPAGTVATTPPRTARPDHRPDAG